MGRKSVEINPECGKRLRLLIKENGTTQKQLADDIHVSEQTIYKIVNGKISLSNRMVEEILKRYPNYCTDLWLLGKSEYKTNEDEAQAIKDRILGKLNQQVRENIKHRERMLSVFAQLVSECGYLYSDGVIKKQIRNTENLSPLDLKFYESLSFPVSNEEIDFLYSSFESIVKTFIEKKTNYIEK